MPTAQSQSTQSSRLFRTAFAEMMKGVCTAAPGHVLTFDPVLQRAQVQVGVQTVAASGATSEPPPIVDVPVLFPGGTQFAVIHQVGPGDEGLIIFSQRCVDGWKQTGGVATNPLARFHDTHDAFFVPGFRPLPTRLPGFVSDGVRMQSADGTRHVWVKASGEIIADNSAGQVQIAPDGAVNVTAATTVNITNGAGTIQMAADGTVTINGVAFAPDGKMTSNTTMTVADVIVGGISTKTHKHTGVVAGGAVSGGPTN
ncbi:Gp138 family membrane-puncturing spike protein [Castellaniella sp. UC4442_H9]